MCKLIELIVLIKLIKSKYVFSMLLESESR